MSVPRHGIFPVGDGAGRVYLAGGGTRVANSQSTNHTLFEVA